MGVWNKISGFFGRVWNGIKSGAKKVGKFLTTVAEPIYNAAKPIIQNIPGVGTAITTGIDTALPVIKKLTT